MTIFGLRSLSELLHIKFKQFRLDHSKNVQQSWSEVPKIDKYFKTWNQNFYQHQQNNFSLFLTMTKVKIPPEERIYDVDGYWLRAACVCVKDQSESEVSEVLISILRFWKVLKWKSSSCYINTHKKLTCKECQWPLDTFCESLLLGRWKLLTTTIGLHVTMIFCSARMKSTFKILLKDIAM